MLCAIINELGDAVGFNAELLQNLNLSFSGDESLPSCFQTTALASSSMMVAAMALAELHNTQLSASRPGLPKSGSPVTKINVDQRLASLWFNQSLFPLDWQMQSLWDSIAGDYACRDGWIRLHTNAPHHKHAALKVLRCEENCEDVVKSVVKWNGSELEQAIVDAGGCAAQMRSIEQWQQHPQGMSVANEPLIDWTSFESRSTARVVNSKQSNTQPLTGIRVLDLTRVLAGPTSTRFLAAYGADILRIDPEHWNEPGVVPEVTLGKRCAHIDLKSRAGREQFIELVKNADILVHGYRPGAMIGLGLGDEELRSYNSNLVTVSLCAYGWTGPWSQRRGFDSLVQMSSGIANEGMLQYQTDTPKPLPVQALDHATGYLMAAAALHALTMREEGKVMSARLSLARTAQWLCAHKQAASTVSFNAVTPADLDTHIENTAWGAAKRVKFPVTMDNVLSRWSYPAGELRAVAAAWV